MRLHRPDKDRMSLPRQMNIVKECRFSAQHLAILQPGDRMSDKCANAVWKSFGNFHDPLLRDPDKPDNCCLRFFAYRPA